MINEILHLQNPVNLKIKIGTDDKNNIYQPNLNAKLEGLADFQSI